MAYTDFGFKKSANFDDSLGKEMINTHRKDTRKDYKRKDHLDSEKPSKKLPQRTMTHNVPTDDVENNNGTD